MAAKLLHSLTDDNPDLQKQIGCMTGVFQLFDRQHIIAGRRISGHSSKRPPSGSSQLYGGTFDRETSNIYHRPQAVKLYLQEKQRVSTESSRPSFSSSSRSSSFSSIDFNRTVQPEPLSFDRMILPDTPLRDPAMSQSGASPQYGRQSVDLRDVVKDSMYREARGLSVKTTLIGEEADRTVKHRDSPRPLPQLKTRDVPYSMGPNVKQNSTIDLKESIRVLNKLREAPWYFNEPRELTRSASSYEPKDGSLLSVAKDAPRFSYDGKEANRISFESRDTSKPSIKLKELPRLSLDSREASVHSFISDAKSNFASRISEKNHAEVASLQQISQTQTRPASVVAKLMGLETLPDSTLVSDSKVGSTKTYQLEESYTFSRSSKTSEINESPAKMSNSARNTWKEPTSPRWKNPDSVMKPIARFPLEPAPWRQLDGARGTQKSASKHLKAPAKALNSFPSVYSEIDKRLKDLEFTQSGKDLRALKQILESMQAKGLLETRMEGHDSNFATHEDLERRHASAAQSARLINPRKPQTEYITASSNRGSTSLRAFESPIVIIKPAKRAEQSRIHVSPVITLDGLSTVHKRQGVGNENNRKASINGRAARDQIPRPNHRDSAVNSTDMRTNGKNIKLAQTSTRSQQVSKESTASLIKSSGSTSPRLQQKKLELEKRSRPPTPPSDSSKSRRQLNKQQSESTSPGGRRRPKSSNFHQSDDQCSETSSEIRSSSYQDNDSSPRSCGNFVSDSTIDIEVASFVRSGDIHSSRSPSMRATKYSVHGVEQKKLIQTLGEDESLVELATVVPEYRSPVSVLDGAVYIDDAPSPVKQIPKTLKGDGNWNCLVNSKEEQWSPEDDLISNSTGSALTSEISRKKLQNIEHLVQKLRRLNSSHDEARTDYIASLCENTNPDHRYISEILLASGLLLRDLGSSLTAFHFHPSGHPINPELFLVLEQTKASTLLKDEFSTGKDVQLKHDKGKCHRKLIFDAVNEILVKKLASLGHPPDPWLSRDKLAKKSMNAQKLLRELCWEIEQLQVKKPKCSEVDEDDGFKSILWEDVMHRSESWTDFRGEISGMVLDVERLIFKDLVGEIVTGEAAGLRAKPGRHCRQLFVK
ncbi:hypothetical protein RJ640_015051 [Escallonia rubra]|uniref:DUF4378 domain-containing protein n=1 Tax=Escallonia rubra TaxID=112253 RepID=A0AA88UL81_9ASTE|nr:hypothetical protein RJ640_015051 [Escallonia rubra]